MNTSYLSKTHIAKNISTKITEYIICFYGYNNYIATFRSKIFGLKCYWFYKQLLLFVLICYRL